MIQPTGLAVLDTLGLGDEIRRAGARVDRLFGRAEANGPVVLQVRYSALGRKGVHGLGVHRAALFDVLHRAVLSSDLPVQTGREVTGSEEQAGQRRLRFSDGRHDGPFDLVVDALGFSSPLAPDCGRVLSYGALWSSLDWLEDAGFDAAALEQRYRRASVMAGVLPIGLSPGRERPQAAFFWSLRTNRLPAWRTAGLEAWKRDVLGLWPATAPLLEQITDAEQLTFARYAHRTLEEPAGRALAHIGDSWHSASPQLGQGANMALLDAYALALALRTERDVGWALARYHALRRRHVALYQLMSALFTPVYQSDSRALPFLRDRIVGPLAKLWPATWIQAAMVSGLIGSPLTPLGLKQP
jgi:2-polyprenyl-6-methoxyphenol hydroxylase-like FAD-dependent oxidoreductase